MENSTNEIYDITQRIEAGLIHSAGEKIQKLYTNAAISTMELKSKHKKTENIRRKKSKKWFDKECVKLKKSIHKLGREKLKHPEKNLIKTKYHEKLKELKTKCRKKRFDFWQNKFQDINDSLNNSKDFWNKWKNASEEFKSSETSSIKGEAWYNHFNGLHTQSCSHQIIPELLPPHPQNDVYIDELNKPFTKEEF